MKEKKKKNGWIFWIILAIIILPELSGTSGESGVLPALIILTVIIAAAVSIFKKGKKKNKKGSFIPEYKTASSFAEKMKENFTESKIEHSHDRLSPKGREYESPSEHWERQLKGFLEAGLIDKKEYNFLWNKYKDKL